MNIKKVTRSYSKSINTRTYGAPESWVKIECIYEAEIESTDDPTKISAMIFEQAKKEVIDDTNAIVAKIRESITPNPVFVPAAPAPVPPPVETFTPPTAMPPADTFTATPPAPIYTAPATPIMPVQTGGPVPAPVRL